MTGLQEHDGAEPLDAVDALLVECLQQPPERRAATLDQICTREPGHAVRLRRRYAFLCQSGLIDLAAPHPPLPERIGGYRILRRLGEGGMGVVYLAEQESLGRNVAVKLVRSELLHSPRTRERFRREALAASRLDHPGICPVYEVGEADGQPFLVMRFLPGRSLLAHLDERRQRRELPDVAATVARLATVARALHAAHAAGLVHRDVKPGNIQITDDGEPVLLDFGLALLLESEQTQLTRSGDVLGTPAYLAPEQIDGHGRVGPPTDVYALGVVLYECLTLQLPFAAATREGMYRRILEGGAEPARRRNRAIPADLEVVLAVAMDRDPARRYATAAAFAADLEAVLRAQPIAARLAPPWVRVRRWCQRNPSAATALVVLAAGLAAVSLLLGTVQRSARALAAQNAARRFWDLRDRDPTEAVRAAIAAQDVAGPEADAALRAAATLAWPEDGFQPQEPLSIGFGLDPRRELAVWIDQRGGGWLWQIGGGEAGVRRFDVQKHFAPQVQFASDGARFAVAGNDGDRAVRIFDREGRLERELRPHPGGVVAVAWHPSRPLLAAGCRDFRADGSTRNAIVLWDLEQHAPVREIPLTAWPWNMVFDADGRLVVATGARHLPRVPALRDVVEFPVEVWSVNGERLARHVVHREPVFRMAVSDGKVLTGGHDMRAVLWDYAAGDEPVDLAGHGDAVCGVAFAGDGTVVTACLDGFLRRFDRAGALQLSFPIGSARADNVVVVPGTGELLVPCYDGVTRVFSPRGMLLRRFHTQRFGFPGEGVALLADRRVLVANAWGRVGVWALDAGHRFRVDDAERVVTDAAGAIFAVVSRKPRQLQVVRKGAVALRVPLDAQMGALTFSSDGRWLAAGGTDGRVLVADLTRDQWHEIRPHGRQIDHLRFSNDGEAFTTSGRHNHVTVYRRELDTWREDESFSPGHVEYAIPLRVGGGALHLMLHTSSGLGIWRWAERGSVLVHPLTDVKVDGGVYSVDASRDGRRLAVTQLDRSVRLWLWDGARAEPAGRRLPHDRPPTWCRFDASGSRLVTIDGDRFAWVWSWEGELLTCIRSPDDQMFQNAWFQPDDRGIVTRDTQQSIERWPIDLTGTEEELARRWRLSELAK